MAPCRLESGATCKGMFTHRIIIQYAFLWQESNGNAAAASKEEEEKKVSNPEERLSQS